MVEKVDSLFGISDIEKEKAILIGFVRELAAEIKSFPKIKSIVENASGPKDLVTATRQLTEVQTKLAATNQKLEESQKRIMALEQKAAQERAKTAQQEQKIDQELEKTKQQRIKTQQQQLNFEKQLNQEKARSRSTAEAEAKLAEKATNDYYQLNLALKDAEQRYIKLALATNFQGEAQEEALQEALKIRAVLDKLDGNLRNYQRNVGNYKSAFDGLGFSFTQVARELPALAINTQTFFTAISNNLPAVFDAIGDAKKEIAGLRAEGKETPSLFSRIGKSIFSLQVGLSLLVTLLTFFGPKLFGYIKNLLGFGDASEEAAKALDRLRKSQLEVIKIQEELNAILFYPITGENRLEKELKIAQALGKSRGDILEIEKKILAQRALDANKLYINDSPKKEDGTDKTIDDFRNDYESALISLQDLQRLLGKEADEDAQDNLKKEIDRAQVKVDLTKTLYEKQKKIILDNFNTAVELDTKEAEIRTYLAEQALIKRTEAAKLNASLTIAANQRVLDSELTGEKQKVAAIDKTAAARRKSAQSEIDKITGTPGNYFQGKLTADAQARVNELNAEIGFRVKGVKILGQIDRQAEDEKFKLQEEYRKRRLAADLEIFKAETEFAAAQYEQVSASDAKDYADRMDALGSFIAAEQQLIKADYEYQREIKGLNNKELLAQDATAQKELLTLTADTQRKLKELAEKGRKAVSEVFVSSQMNQLTQADKEDQLALSAENLSLYKKYKNKAKFEAESEANTRKLARQTVENNLSADRQIVASSLTTEEAKKAAALRILDNQKKLNELDLDDAKRVDAEKKAMLQTYYQAYEQFFSLVKELADADFDREEAQLEERRKRLDEDTERRINQINLLGLTEQERIRQTAIVEKEAQFQRDQIEIRRRRLAEQRAKFEKAANIASIITGTAQAVIAALGKKPYGPDNIILAAVTGAIGAIQLAKAIATPIPKYKMGRGYGKEEIAFTGDGGVHEYIWRASGKIEKTPKVATLTHLMPKDRVFKDETALAMEMMRISTSFQKTRFQSTRSDDGWDPSSINRLITATEKKQGVKIMIVNKAPIESTAYYQHNIKT